MLKFTMNTCNVPLVSTVEFLELELLMKYFFPSFLVIVHSIEYYHSLISSIAKRRNYILVNMIHEIINKSELYIFLTYFFVFE